LFLFLFFKQIFKYILGLFKFKLQKVNRGEHFDGLELLTKLLTPAGQGNNPPANKPLIEELDKAGI
jgi:hypothetical protein